MLFPQRAGGLTLLELHAAVAPERHDELRREGQGPPAPFGLGLLVHESLAGHAVQPTADGERADVEVDVGPAKPQRLGLAEAYGQRDSPPRWVAALLGGLQHSPRLIDRQRECRRGALDGRRVDERRHVAHDFPALHGDAQSARQHPVQAENGRGGQALVVEQRAVQLFQVLWLQTVEAVVTDAGAQVQADQRLVALQGASADAARRDVLEPVVEPVADGRCSASCLGSSCVALGLQGPNLGNDVSPPGAGDVPPITPPVLLESYGDVAVPAARRVLVDRRLAGCCAVAHV